MGKAEFYALHGRLERDSLNLFLSVYFAASNVLSSSFKIRYMLQFWLYTEEELKTEWAHCLENFTSLPWKNSRHNGDRDNGSEIENAALEASEKDSLGTIDFSSRPSAPRDNNTTVSRKTSSLKSNCRLFPRVDLNEQIIKNWSI